jgi:hypothetical protein
MCVCNEMRLLLLSLLCMAAARANLNNSKYGCIERCTGGNVCYDTNPRQNITRNVGINFDASPKARKSSGCFSASNEVGAGISMRSYTCRRLDVAGVGMRFNVTATQPTLAFSFWMKSYLISQMYGFAEFSAHRPDGSRKFWITLEIHNGKLQLLYMTAPGVGNTYETDTDIQYDTHKWAHIVVSVERYTSMSTALCLYYNGVRILQVPAELTNDYDFTVDTRVALAMQGPLGSVSPAYSLMSFADVMVFNMPTKETVNFVLTDAAAGQNLVFNTFYKRDIYYNPPIYPVGSAITSPPRAGFTYHSAVFPGLVCAACPCAAPGTCTVTPTGFTATCAL